LPEYDQILWRVVDAHPTDSWLEDELHFFVFQLEPENRAAAEPPMAVFAATTYPRELVSAVIVSPSVDGETAEVVDIREPESSYVAPLDR
jgi:hypothetical protein